MTAETRKGSVFAIVQNLISVKINAPVMNKEICYVTCSKTGERLMAEAIKVQSGLVNIQVFESTRGVKVGDPVEFTGNMLQVTLGPGLLSKNLDGLQNDLDKIPGTFLKRGSYNVAIELEKEYEFIPSLEPNATVTAGDWLGHVKENWFDHQIMVPFHLKGKYKIASI